jgi:thioredoxin-dependent peroxiredoxin
MRSASAVLALGVLAFVAFADDKKEGKVEEGKPMPEIKVPAVNIDKGFPAVKDAKELDLPKDAKGKNVVLFFFPKAMTRGWTIENCGFRDRAEQFAQLDTVLIGISVDKLEDEQKFTEKEKLNFPIVADADGKAATAFGVRNPNGHANRVTFVIDKKGVVRKIYEVKDVEKHPEEVLNYVKENLANKKWNVTSGKS